VKHDRVGLHARVAGNIADVEPRVRAALADEGFGIIMELDLERILNDRTGKDVGPYKLLGACNPEFAHTAVSAWKGFGVHLPCNVVLYEAGGSCVIEAADPTSAAGVSGHPVLADLAREVRERLERALSSLE
jgi:uncharacterized protein (DUF302 family)